MKNEVWAALFGLNLALFAFGLYWFCWIQANASIEELAAMSMGILGIAGAVNAALICFMRKE